MRGLQDDHFTHFWPKGPPPSAKLILVLVISLSLITLDDVRDTLDPLRDTMATVLQPLTVVAELPAEIMEFASKYLDRDELIARNRALQRKVLLLKGQLQKMAALQAENERIRQLRARGRRLEDRVMLVEILSVSPGPYRHYFTINKGSLAGVHKGQALIDGNGLMGHVISTTPMSATAIMITDPDSAVPVEVVRTGLLTIARGQGKAKPLILPYLPANAAIREGDLLVTSGLAGEYPAGYPVATVTRITHRKGDEFLTVLAEPEASLNRGRMALLVWSQPPAPDVANSTAANAAASPRAASGKSAEPTSTTQ